MAVSTVNPPAKTLPFDHKPRFSNTVAFWIVMAFVAVAYLLWPGDAPFINDEPMMFEMAANANSFHQLADGGMFGTLGTRYGPLPIWIYQSFLLVSRRPEIWVLMRSALMLVTISIGVFLIGRALKLTKWFIPLALLSPYSWFYARHMWDNSFLLPLTSLALGSYLLFLANRNNIALRAAIAFTLALPLIHFMALPLTATVLLHMALVCWRDIWKDRIWVAFVVALGATLHARYFGVLFSGATPFVGAKKDIGLSWEGLIFPLYGGRLFTGWALEYYFGEPWMPGLWFRIIAGVSALGFAVTIVGIGRSMQTISGFFKSIRTRKDGLFAFGRADVRVHAAAIVLCSLFIQMIEFQQTRTSGHPHYLNSLWAVYACVGWLVVDRMLQNQKARVWVAVYGMSLAVMLASVVIRVHMTCGTRGLYGPTISHLHELAAQIGNTPREDLYINSFPQKKSLAVLSRLSVPDNSKRLDGPLTILRESDDVTSGRFRVVQRR